jgi:hypothetical protein
MNYIREKQKTAKKDFMVPDEHFQSMCYWSTVRNLFKPTIYHTLGEHANYYIIDAVSSSYQKIIYPYGR